MDILIPRVCSKAFCGHLETQTDCRVFNIGSFWSKRHEGLLLQCFNYSPKPDTTGEDTTLMDSLCLLISSHSIQIIATLKKTLTQLDLSTWWTSSTNPAGFYLKKPTEQQWNSRLLFLCSSTSKVNQTWETREINHFGFLHLKNKGFKIIPQM